MSTQSLLHLDGRWLAFDGDRVSSPDARPKLDRAATAIVDFDGAVSQVIALEGSPAHAVALIEKRLRADGLIDNESKILIHQTKTVGNGYQALFTAIPLDRWQQMFAWAEGHDDHCLLVPSLGLLWKMLRPGRGIVLHSGRQFTFLASLRNRIVHVAGLAFSESDKDLAMTVSALADRAGRELSNSDEALEVVEVEWYGSLTRAPATAGASLVTGGDDSPTQRTPPAQPADKVVPPGLQSAPPAATAAAGHPGEMTFDGQFDSADKHEPAEAKPAEAKPITPKPAPAAPTPAHRAHKPHAGIAAGRWTDEALMEIFSANSGTKVRLGNHVMVRDGNGHLYRSGIAGLAAHANALSAVNPAGSRLMFLAERVLPWASAASLLLALALAALGGRWTLAASTAHDHAESLDSQIALIDAEIGSLRSKQTLPEAYPQVLKFVERAGTLQRALDPNRAMQDLRAAAGNDVRILRLRLEDDIGNKGTRLRIDGMVKHSNAADSEGMQIARFVQRLRDAGYTTEAIDPQQGNLRSQSVGGSFSYLLRRADATTTEKAS